MSEWREWLEEMEERAQLLEREAYTVPDAVEARCMVHSHSLPRLFEGYRLLAEAVEAVGRFWEEGIAEAKQAVDRGDLTEDNMDEWFLERFVKSGRDADASEKIQRSLAHLRGVGID